MQTIALFVLKCTTFSATSFDNYLYFKHVFFSIDGADKVFHTIMANTNTGKNIPEIFLKIDMPKTKVMPPTLKG